MESEKKDKMVSKIEKILEPITSEYLCRIQVDPEPEMGVYWVNLVLNSKYLELRGMDRMLMRLELSDKIEKTVTDFLGVPCVCGMTMDENC